MDKTAKTIIGVLVVVILLILFLPIHRGIMAPVVAAITVITTIVLLYVCIRLYLKFNNPYFKLTAVSYGLQLATWIVWSLASLGEYLSFLSFGGSIPVSTSSSWFTVIRLLLIMYAALLYREGWEDKERVSITERFTALVPAAKTYNFWVILIGAPLVFNIIRQLFYFHIFKVSYNVRFAGHLPIPTGIMAILTQTVTMLIMLLIVILNLSLFRTYGIRFFKHLYIISLVIVIYSVAWGMFSLYMDWLFGPPNPGQSQALGFLSGHTALVSFIPALYQLAVPVFTALVFLAYEESRGLAGESAGTASS